MLLLDTEETLGMYKELRKKKIQLQKDVSNSFYYSCRRAPALRRRTAADTTFYISSSACALADKVHKSHFTESYNKKIVCSSQQTESCLPYKINFYVVIYSLTSLIGNKDKTIEKKQTWERHMYIRSVPMCWEHWKQGLICHASASKLSWAAALKPVLHLPHLQHRAFLLSDEPPRLCDPSPTEPGGCHPRSKKKPRRQHSCWETLPACRPCICRDSHPDTPQEWDLAEPCHTNHLLYPVLCKSTLDWKAQFVLPCAAIFHSYTSSTAESHGTQGAKPQTTGLRCGEWGLGKPAEQTGSLIKLSHSCCRSQWLQEKAWPSLPIPIEPPWGSNSPSQVISHWIAASTAGHQKASHPAPQKHSSSTGQTHQYLQFPHEGDSPVALGISVTRFLHFQTSARDKANPSGQVTPFWQQAVQWEGSSSSTGNSMEGRMGSGNTSSHPALITLCQSLVSILLQQWTAKVKKKQKQKGDEPHTLSTQSSWY